MAMEIITMMIPMDSSLMTVTMATMSPLWEEISPADCSLPESFSLSRVSASWRRRNFPWTMYYALGLRRVEVRERGLTPVGQGHHTTCSRARGASTPPGGVGPIGTTWVPFLAPPVIWDNRNLSMIFFRKGSS